MSTGRWSEKGGRVRSDQWAGRREVIRKDFQQSAGQYDLNGCTAPRCRAVCAVADIIGKSEGLSRVKECLT